MGLFTKLAAAPISWGVCEVPGWGRQLAPERVLEEMSLLGIVATELGPAGYLGDEPASVVTQLERHRLRCVGGFVPLVLHDAARRDGLISAATASATVLAAVGAEVFVTAVVTDLAWSPREELDDGQWQAMFEGFGIVDEICAAHGVRQVLHPHVGTLVETADDVRRVLDGSSVRWCLDTGHLLIGGTDPFEFATQYRERVDHVHLKDVRMAVAEPLNAGTISLLDATRQGLFCPLGQGDAPIAEVVAQLERSGYDRWYVLEQDTTLTGPEPPPGQGPLLDVVESVEYLRTLVTDPASAR